MQKYNSYHKPLKRTIKNSYFMTLKSRAHQIQSMKMTDPPFLRKYRCPSLKGKIKSFATNLKEDSDYVYTLKTIIILTSKSLFR